MRIKVLKAFDYIPTGERRMAFSYRPDGSAGGIYTVKQEAGEVAIARGDAELVTDDGGADAPPARRARGKAEDGTEA